MEKEWRSLLACLLVLASSWIIRKNKVDRQGQQAAGLAKRRNESGSGDGDTGWCLESSI